MSRSFPHAPALAAAVTIVALLTSCTGGGASPSPSATPTASAPSASPTASTEVTAQPSPTPSPTAVPTATPSPSPSASETTDVGTGDVAVVVTRAAVSKGMFEVGGFVDGLVEDGGTCIVTLTSGARTVELTGPGLINATTTSCGAGLSTPASEIAGEWTLVLTYRSGSHEGSSAESKVTIP